MTLVVVHVAATWFMVGLIWMTQVVHYPLFSAISAEDFIGYERSHTRRMGALLTVPALTEIVTGAALVFAVPGTTNLPMVLAAGGLLAAIWVMTAMVHAPLHRRLSHDHDPALILRLVGANWWRTAAWSARGVLVALML